MSGSLAQQMQPPFRTRMREHKTASYSFYSSCYFAHKWAIYAPGCVNPVFSLPLNTVHEFTKHRAQLSEINFFKQTFDLKPDMLCTTMGNGALERPPLFADALKLRESDLRLRQSKASCHPSRGEIGRMRVWGLPLPACAAWGGGVANEYLRVNDAPPRRDP